MELQRSVTSFRRQGSSGMVWDDKFLAGLWDQNQNQNENEKDDGVNNDSKNQAQENERGHKEFQSVGVESSTDAVTLQRSRSAGAKPYRTVNVAPPWKDPPSPKVATCGGICGFFGKSASDTKKSSNNNPKSKKRR